MDLFFINLPIQKPSKVRVNRKDNLKQYCLLSLNSVHLAGYCLKNRAFAEFRDQFPKLSPDSSLLNGNQLLDNRCQIETKILISSLSIHHYGNLCISHSINLSIYEYRNLSVHFLRNRPIYLHTNLTVYQSIKY